MKKTEVLIFRIKLAKSLFLNYYYKYTNNKERNMTQEEIFNIIREIIIELLPEVEIDKISIEKSLSALGANSIDRSEIVMESMMQLGVKASLVELGHIKNIQGLVDFYYQKLNDST